jgi:hypothetical protein
MDSNRKARLIVPSGCQHGPSKPFENERVTLPLKLYNTRELIAPDKFKLKILIYGMAGSGKTSFMASANSLEHKLLAGVCETGMGKGQLSAASTGYTACDLESYNDFQEFCTKPPAGFDVYGLDSLSWANKTFVKDKALAIPRAKGESQKRLLGVPELDDYGVMGELSRKLVQQLLNQPTHIIITAGLRIDKPDFENGQGDVLVGPDLPGAMFLGVTAMVDVVLYLGTRSVLRDPRDAKSRYTERYFITENTGGRLAKNRLSVNEKGVSFLPTEVLFDPASGLGTFDWFLNKAKAEYTKYLLENPVKNAT